MWQAYFIYFQDTFVKTSTLNLFLHHSLQLKLQPAGGKKVVSSDRNSVARVIFLEINIVFHHAAEMLKAYLPYRHRLLTRHRIVA